MRWVIVGVLGVLALLVMFADRRRPVAPPDAGRPERIVSLAPNLTEIVCRLGGGNRLVGVTTLCEGVDSEIPRVGGLQVDVERILALEPDRVLAIETESQRASLDFLTQRDIVVEVFRAESVADVLAIVSKLGRSLDAVPTATELERRFDAVLAAPAPADDDPSVLFLVEWGPPHYVAGGGSFVQEMLHAAGARNVFGDHEKPYVTVDFEGILARDPDIIIDVTLGGGAGPGRWSQLTQLQAVRHNAVSPFPHVRPGPGIPDWVAQLKAIVADRRP